MKKIVITLIALALGMTAFAQFGPSRPGGGMSRGYSSSRPGRGYGYAIDGELEVGFSVNYFTGHGVGDLAIDRSDHFGIFGEYRMDMGGFVDIGMQLSTTFGKGTITWQNPLPATDKAMFWQGACLMVADFNLIPYSGFNPFAGFGIGPGFGFQGKNDVTGPSEWTHALVLAPRAGVELFECFRMTVQYQWYLNDPGRFSHFSFGLSWAFEPGMGRPMRR